MNTISLSTPLQDYITEVLPWAHGHQIKAITVYVAAIIDKQTGSQAALARGFGNQEAACKRISRLLHNQRLKPNDLAEAVIHQALSKCLPTKVGEGDEEHELREDVLKSLESIKGYLWHGNVF